MKTKIKNLVKHIVILSMLMLLFSCNKTVKDADGNVYDVVKIGNQYWLKQNLRTTKYNDGYKIPYIVEQDSIGLCKKNTIGFYADYEKTGIHAKNIKYGKFYNWHAVNTGKLAPKGWHVATKEDWDELKKFIGPNLAGNKLRTTYDWVEKEHIVGKGTDTYGFSGLPTGYKNWGSSYWSDSLENLTVFWTSTRDKNQTCNQDHEVYPFTVTLGLANSGNLSVEKCNCENFEYSVRCVKDKLCIKK